MTALSRVPFDDDRWSWGTCTPTSARVRGKRCLRLQSGLATFAADVLDGAVELDLAVTGDRGFHGVAWRVQDEESFESFFVRPHQVGNPDAVQYTPVFNGISSWQLYHGPGFWAPVSFPLGGWFTIRVVFEGERADVYVADLAEPVLVVAELKRPVAAGRLGIMVGGPSIHVARFAHGPAGLFPLRDAPTVPEPTGDGVIPAWEVSDAFAEEALGDVVRLDDRLLASRAWSHLPAEPSGLTDLSRINGIREGRNTVLARTTVHSARARVVRLELGFSDRAVVFLNGRALFRGDDGYRSRDYRFLGSIGYWDTLFVELREGANELAVAVSEDFGGWGVQARFPDHAGLSFG